MNDINRSDQAHQEHNRMPITFDEMVSYLLSKENCSVQGSYFTVINLHKFVNKANEHVKLIPLSERKKNVMCTSTKRNLKKVFKAYLNGEIDVVGLYKPKAFSNYLKS